MCHHDGCKPRSSLTPSRVSDQVYVADSRTSRGISIPITRSKRKGSEYTNTSNVVVYELGVDLDAAVSWLRSDTANG